MFIRHLFQDIKAWLLCFVPSGAGVNLQTCDGNTALTEACRHGHKKTVKLLLQHHADANKASNAGLLPLHIASQHGHEEWEFSLINRYRPRKLHKWSVSCSKRLNSCLMCCSTAAADNSWDKHSEPPAYCHSSQLCTQNPSPNLVFLDQKWPAFFFSEL